MNAPTVVSVFSGAGGLDLGFTQAGFASIYATDIDVDSMATYAAWKTEEVSKRPELYEGGHTIEVADIKDLKALPAKADVVIGGPPCQGFSVAGRMDPSDPRSQRVWDFFRVVDKVQPRAFVMENVPALAENTRWTNIKVGMMAAAHSMGYATSLHILDASHYGVPQARRRMFFIGIKADEAVAAPKPTTEKMPPPAWLALDSLPPWGTPGNDTVCSAKVVPAKNPVLRKSPYAGMLFNGQGRPMDIHKPSLTIPATMGGNRTPIIDQHQLVAGGNNWAEEYHADLMTGTPPLSDSVPSRMRRITVEEAAALQSFPQGMHWAGEQTSQYHQIGNAVPPKLAFHVAMKLRLALAKEEN